MYIKACAQCQDPTDHPIPLPVVRVTIAVSAHVTRTHTPTRTHARTTDTDRPTDRPITDTVIGDAFAEGHHLEPVSDFVLTPSQRSYYAIDSR